MDVPSRPRVFEQDARWLRGQAGDQRSLVSFAALILASVAIPYELSLLARLGGKIFINPGFHPIQEPSIET